MDTATFLPAMDCTGPFHVSLRFYLVRADKIPTKDEGSVPKVCECGMGDCRLRHPQWCALGSFAGLVKILLGKISLLELGRSPWLLLPPFPVHLLTNHSWLRALLSAGSYCNLQWVSWRFRAVAVRHYPSIFEAKVEAGTSHSVHQINFLIDFDSTHSCLLEYVGTFLELFQQVTSVMLLVC